MAKNKKKQVKRDVAEETAVRHAPMDAEPSDVSVAAPSVGEDVEESPVAPPRPLANERGAQLQDDVPACAHAEKPRCQPRWHRGVPDLIKAIAAVVVIGVAVAIWYQPLLVASGFPYVSYTFKGQRLTDAVLYRPLAMPTRYYVVLPRSVGSRYEWFAVDRRREVVALADAPRHRIMGRPAIRRSDPLGLDLEFRKLDGSEWRIFFLEDAIVFSNALLAVRLDTRKGAPEER